MIRAKTGDALDEEEKRLRQLRGAVDRLCEEIKRGLSEADVRKRAEEIRALCAELFPDKLELFDQLYGRRFQRLREQFGPKELTRKPEDD